MLSIHTVAAGGGSVLHFDGSRYRVGPDSAGASPGPACYRHGGPLTVTDANLMLGRIQPGYFPRVFGPDGDQPLDAGVTAQRFAELAGEISAADGPPADGAEVAAGFLEIAVANMANAIKKILCSAATTSPGTCWPRSAARAASTPARSPTSSA